MKFVGAIKKYVSKKLLAVSAVMSLALVAAQPAFAEYTPVTLDTSQSTGIFGDIGTAVLLVIGTVAATAVAVMGSILAFKYGRKIWNMVAK